MNKTQRKRLEKLRDHLSTLKPERFDFGRVVREFDSEHPKCKTVACAIGWTPLLFPELVKWDVGYGYSTGLALTKKGAGTKYNPEDIGRNQYDILAEALFGIHRTQAEAIFSSCKGYSTVKDIHLKLPRLVEQHNRKITPKRVANLLTKYMELVDAKEINPVEEVEEVLDI